MILTVDIGTSSLKGGLFSKKGELLFAQREIYAPQPPESFDPAAWVEAFLSFLYQVKETTSFCLDRITGVSISGHGPTLVPVDKKGVPTSSALMWFDEKVEGSLSPSFYIPRAIWLSKKNPPAYERTVSFLGCAEYLLFLLTGDKVMVRAGEDFAPYIWTDKRISKAHLDIDKFPDYSELGQKSSSVISKAGAEMTGLKDGVPVYSGGSDFFTALLGAGAVEQGVLCDRAGTSEGLNIIAPHKPSHDNIRYLPHPAQQGMWNDSVILSSTGSLFEWYRNLTGQGDWSYEKTMKGILSSAGKGCPDFFPSLKEGGLWEFSGGMLLGIDPTVDRFQLGHSVLEAIGFALKNGLNLLEQERLKVERFVTVGGQAKNPIWNQMKADMLGREVEVPLVADAELLGCLVVFLTGEGEYDTLSDAARALYKIKEVRIPEKSAFYKERFDRYKGISQQVKSFYGKNIKLLKRL